MVFTPLVGEAASLAHVNAHAVKLGELEADLAHVQADGIASRCHPLDLLNAQPCHPASAT